VKTPTMPFGSDYHSSMTDNVQLPFPDAGKETGRQLGVLLVKSLFKALYMVVLILSSRVLIF